MPPEAGPPAGPDGLHYERGGFMGRRMPAPLRIGLADLGTLGAGVLRLVESPAETSARFGCAALAARSARNAFPG
jgi:hypothetical protein